ncbi:hypothetical protein [Sphingobium sp.]
MYQNIGAPPSMASGGMTLLFSNRSRGDAGFDIDDKSLSPVVGVGTA